MATSLLSTTQPAAMAGNWSETSLAKYGFATMNIPDSILWPDHINAAKITVDPRRSSPK